MNDEIDVIGYVFGSGDALTWVIVGMMTAIFLFSVVVNTGKGKCKQS